MIKYPSNVSSECQQFLAWMNIPQDKTIIIWTWENSGFWGWKTATPDLIHSKKRKSILVLTHPSVCPLNVRVEVSCVFQFHSLTVLSADAERRREEEDEKQQLITLWCYWDGNEMRTLPSCPFNTLIHFPCATSLRDSKSSHPYPLHSTQWTHWKEKMHNTPPSKLSKHHGTYLSTVLHDLIHVLVSTLHTLIVLSADEDVSNFPSNEKQHDITLSMITPIHRIKRTSSVCSVNVWLHSPVSTLHSLTVLS